MNAAAVDPVPVANLLRMAFYAGDLLEEFEDCEAAHDDGCHFVELLGRMLANAASRIRRRGYGRGYHEEVECSASPKGRMLLNASVATAAVASGRLHYLHDEFSEDCVDNRILKCTVLSLLSGPNRGRLREETEADLEAVRADLGSVRRVRLDDRLFASLQRGPAGRRYRVVRFVARILAEGLQPDAEQTGSWAVGLVQDARRMRAVFERFVGRFAHHHLPSAVRVLRPRYVWNQDESAVVDPRVPILVPDAVLREKARARVVECKYTPRLLERGPHDAIARLRSPHLQQLFGYLAAEARRGRPVSGLLLYPRVGDAVRVDLHLGPFPTTVATIDLSRPWRELVTEMTSVLWSVEEAEGSASLVCVP